MNDILFSDDALLTVSEAGLFLDDVFERLLALPLAKAFDLGTTRDFERAVSLLGAKLRASSRKSDAQAVRDSLSVLDVDWHATPPEQRSRLIARALSTAGRALAPALRAIEAPLSNAASAVVYATRTDSRRRQKLVIGADFNALDRRIMTHVVRSQGNFVRDEHGRRLDDFGERAREIVAIGLEQGLGRDDIAHALHSAASAVFVSRSRSYWNVIASAFVGQARSFAQMSSYAEAGVRRYVVEAVLDEVTTPCCRFLHGKTFSVGEALKRFDAIERLDAPERIKVVAPWIRQGMDPESRRSVLYVNSASGRVPLAEVLRTGNGNHDDLGEFRAMINDRKLGELGIGFPPYHGHCRTTTLAVV
jgi:hypothetical protein